MYILEDVIIAYDSPIIAHIRGFLVVEIIQVILGIFVIRASLIRPWCILVVLHVVI